MNNTSLVFLALLFCSGCSNSGQQRHLENTTLPAATLDSVPRTSQVILPDSATAFIRQHFAGGTVQRVAEKRSPTPKGTFYEARLMDGTEIDFGKAGNWIEVDAEEPSQLPTSFLPEAIRSYLESNFAGIGVEHIDKDRRGYELELTNDINLYFDDNGSLLKQKK